MVDPLAPLLHDGVVEEIIGRLKSGKEADLWLVRHGGEVLAAKVYKAREARSFRNDAVYREGRQVRNTRTQRAMDRGTRFGQAAAEEAWKTRESDVLHTLFAAGVRVPRPALFYEGVLLMELVVDAHGHPAPRLIDAHVPQEQAAALYADLRAQMVRILCCDLVHGDLSPYNVLLGREGPVVIDFPQVVGAAHNRQAEAFFQRDLQNLRRFFSALDPALHAGSGDGPEIWRAYVRRELTPDFVPTGKPPPASRPAHPQGGHPRGAQEHHRGAPGSRPQGQGRGGQEQGRRPAQGRGHGGQDHGRQAQGQGQGGAGHRQGQGPAQGQAHGDRGQGQGQRAGHPGPGRGGPDRRGGRVEESGRPERRGPPGPEVVRVNRTFTPAPAGPRPAHPAHPAPAAAGGARPAGGAPHAGRRHRGRGSGGRGGSGGHGGHGGHGGSRPGP